VSLQGELCTCELTSATKGPLGSGETLGCRKRLRTTLPVRAALDFRRVSAPDPPEARLSLARVGGLRHRRSPRVRREGFVLRSEPIGRRVVLDRGSPGKWVAVNAHDDLAESSPAGDAGAWTTARQAMSAAVADESLSGLPAALQRICRAATSSLPLSGAVVQVITEAREVAVLASSDPASRLLGEITFTVGEGPCLDAFTMGRPVLVPDLLGEGHRRWPGYVSAIREGGLRATYALPLHVGAVRLGVLELYGARVHSLSTAELSLSLVFAHVATDILLEPPSGSSAELLGDRSGEGLGHWVEIHQAQGMVTVDLGLDLAGALSLMRAHAFSRDVPLLEVARMILAGERLHVTDED